MKLINGYWTDENGNRWNEKKYTKEKAEMRSKTLEGCTDCINCEYCEYCEYCSNCYCCAYCNNCTECHYCENCCHCTNCVRCDACAECARCKHCTNCTNCTRCNYCLRCVFCDSCYFCCDCDHCKNCHSCTSCKDCFDCDRCLNAKRYLGNPKVYVTDKIGNWKEQTIFYYGNTKNGAELQVVRGCFWGDLEDFEKDVERIYGDNEHGKVYKREIKKVKMLFDLGKVKEAQNEH